MFQSPHATNFLDCPQFNGGALLVAGTTVVGSGGFGGYFWVGDDFKVLILYVIAASIVLNYSVNFVIFSLES